MGAIYFQPDLIKWIEWWENIFLKICGKMLMRLTLDENSWNFESINLIDRFNFSRKFPKNQMDASQYSSWQVNNGVRRITCIRVILSSTSLLICRRRIFMVATGYGKHDDSFCSCITLDIKMNSNLSLRYQLTLQIWEKKKQTFTWFVC